MLTSKASTKASIAWLGAAGQAVGDVLTGLIASENYVMTEASANAIYANSHFNWLNIAEQ